MDVTHRVEYKIRDLTTRAVTLFPNQAQIQRDIKDVPLRPGVNEIVVVGLSPTVNKDSIKVEGSGSATIVGITVESLPNRELYDDVYPDSDSDSSDEDDNDDDVEEGPEQPGLKEVTLKLVELCDNLTRAQDFIANADERIRVLNAYCGSLDKREGVDIQNILATYKQEREKAHADRMAGCVEERDLNVAINKASQEHARLLKKDQKLKTKASKAQAKIQKIKNKKHQQRMMRQQERLQEKVRIRAERERVWAKTCWTVNIQLEVNSSFTPMSSRRGSVSSDVDVAREMKRSPSRTMDLDEPMSCDLVLSYVTSSAYWTPSYDLQLSTPTSTGSLCFDACLSNTTSETWENCKITLSTSQAAFSGVNDAAPILRPWRIKMAPKDADPQVSDITNSCQELREQMMYLQRNSGAVIESRANAFGSSSHQLQDYQVQLMLLEQQNKKRLMMARQTDDVAQGQQPQAQMQMQQQQHQQQQHIHQQPIAAQQVAQQVVQQQMQQQQMQQQMQQRPIAPLNAQQLQNFSNQSPQARARHSSSQPQAAGMTPPWHVENPQGVAMDLEAPTLDAQPSLDFHESLMEETGLTTTYDLHGLKTLVPKYTPTKHRVARVSFTNVFFGHTVVPKYHAMAYLRARLKNNSRWTLLKGPGSLTLDGSFMGRVTIPRCSSGDTFPLSLGVDPAIRIIYPKAEVQRSKTGMFSKDDCSVYVRSITLRNTRASAKPVNMLVLDQVPVSEDDRLRVDLVSPKGLTLEGVRVPSGEPGRDPTTDKDWGKATVRLKKGGSLCWEVNLESGKSVKLNLEYTVSLPSGEVAEDCAKTARRGSD
ncbi:hypothetical protein QQZ08_009767 [Neonectria magnoliae]|uniref:DUF4139 domain-containing protein n=1 Tax=Neonectria magnoliae TaxID=2732573 RepID=A0ABR1HLN3_9HYPO